MHFGTALIGDLYRVFAVLLGRERLGESFGSVQYDVETSAFRMLGFARVSEDMRVAVEKMRNAMIKEGRLAQLGETVICDAQKRRAN